jgi:hypothetical protein
MDRNWPLSQIMICLETRSMAVFPHDFCSLLLFSTQLLVLLPVSSFPLLPPLIAENLKGIANNKFSL